MTDRAIFQVSLKVLLRDGNKVLFPRSVDGDIDLPGGRIDVGEEALALEDVIRREVREELGENLQFRLGKLLFVYRILRREDAGWKFVMVYDAEYLGGDIALSQEHASYEWVERDAYEVKQADFFEDDREKYEAFRDHFDSLKK